jgi:hypothetical protein
VKEELPPRLTSALDELRTTLDRAAELAKQIESQPKPGSAETAVELQSRLADAESDRRELSERLADYEHQVGRLMNLYVATYQLHATLDPAEVQSTIGEIATNLLGAERFVLLFWKENATECEIALSQGLEGDTSGFFTGGLYSGGDAMVDATLSDGVLRPFRARPWARSCCCICLRTRRASSPRTATCSTSSLPMPPPPSSPRASIRPPTAS